VFGTAALCDALVRSAV